MSARAISGRFTFVDALRGIAATWVLVCHFYGDLARVGPQLPTPLHELAIHGFLGVQVFFVLSGFVIAHSVGAARVSPGFVGRFALRRSLRLDPPYWMAIFAYYVARRMMHGPLTTPETPFNEWQNVLINMFYLDNVLGARSIVAVGWTLCLEVQLYLGFVILFGLMQLLAKKLGEKARLVIFAPIAIYSLLLATGVVTFNRQKFFFLPYWYMFFLGTMVAWSLSGQVKWRWTWIWFGLAFASLSIEWKIQTVVALLAALSIALVGKAGRLGDLLAWRWIQLLGAISYSLYLLHPLLGSRVIRLVLKRLGREPSPFESFVIFTMALAIVLIASWLMYRFVERPSMRFSKRVVLKKRDPIEDLAAPQLEDQQGPELREQGSLRAR